jgi:hypothetical protein
VAGWNKEAIIAMLDDHTACLLFGKD